MRVGAGGCPLGTAPKEPGCCPLTSFANQMGEDVAPALHSKAGLRRHEWVAGRQGAQLDCP